MPKHLRTYTPRKMLAKREHMSRPGYTRKERKRKPKFTPEDPSPMSQKTGTHFL